MYCSNLMNEYLDCLRQNLEEDLRGSFPKNGMNHTLPEIANDWDLYIGLQRLYYFAEEVKFVNHIIFLKK